MPRPNKKKTGYSDDNPYIPAHIAAPVNEDGLSVQAKAKLILTRSLNPEDVDDYAVAEQLLMHFLKPRVDTEQVSFYDANAGEMKETTRVFRRDLPLISEFAHNIGMTEAALEDLGEDFPKTIGLALEVCRDVQVQYLMDNGLKGEYDNRFAEFVTINLTRLRKDGRELRNGDGIKKLSSVLDDIESEGGRLVHAQEPMPMLSAPSAPILQ